MQIEPGDAAVYDTIIFDVHEDGNAMDQRMWPKHCVQNTWGSELHKDLKVINLAIAIRQILAFYTFFYV